jgi:hypothetical protein
MACYFIHAGTTREGTRERHHYVDDPAALPAFCNAYRNFLYHPRRLSFATVMGLISQCEADGVAITWRVAGRVYETPVAAPRKVVAR